MEFQAEHNFGMRVTGKTRGRTGLKVVLSVSDPTAGQLGGNLQELRDEIQIQVHRCDYYFLHRDALENVFKNYLCVMSTVIKHSVYPELPCLS